MLTKVRIVSISNSHVHIWELEGWALKTRCWRRLLDCKEIQPVNPKGNQSWIFIGRTDAKTEAPVLWPSDAKSQFIGKDSHAAKDWRQKERGDRRSDCWMASLTQWTWVCWEIVEDREVWHAAVHGVAKSQTRLSECITTTPGVIKLEIAMLQWSEMNIPWLTFIFLAVFFLNHL